MRARPFLARHWADILFAAAIAYTASASAYAVFFVHPPAPAVIIRSCGSTP